MSLSISCTEVAVARCSTELMLLATISLSFSGGRPRLVTTSRRTNSRSSPSTSVSAGSSCSTVLRILRNAMFDPPVYGAPDEHGNVTAWGPNEQNSRIIECRKCGKDQGPRALLERVSWDRLFGSGNERSPADDAYCCLDRFLAWRYIWRCCAGRPRCRKSRR